MKFAQFLLKNNFVAGIPKQVDRFSKFSPSPLSMKQFIDFGKWTRAICCCFYFIYLFIFVFVCVSVVVVHFQILIVGQSSVQVRNKLPEGSICPQRWHRGHVFVLAQCFFFFFFFSSLMLAVMWLQARPMHVRRPPLCSSARSFLSDWPTSWRKLISSLTNSSALHHWGSSPAGKKFRCTATKIIFMNPRFLHCSTGHSKHAVHSRPLLITS